VFCKVETELRFVWYEQNYDSVKVRSLEFENSQVLLSDPPTIQSDCKSSIHKDPEDTHQMRTLETGTVAQRMPAFFTS